MKLAKSFSEESGNVPNFSSATAKARSSAEGAAKTGPALTINAIKIRVIAENTFQKWWQRRAGKCQARATSISARICEERATPQCPARRTNTGPERLLALLSGWPRSTRDIGCARRLAKRPLLLLPFRKLFWAITLKTIGSGEPFK